MTMNPLEDLYRSGKPVRFLYYAASWLRLRIPRAWLAMRRRSLLKGWEKRPDAAEIRERRDFYCPLPEHCDGGDAMVTAARIDPNHGSSSYYFDLMRWLRYFPKDAKVNFVTGDVHRNPTLPSLIKARRIDDKAGNAVILNFDRVRHFYHPHDNIPFREKRDMLIFRGDIAQKPHRETMMRRWASSTLCDLGDTSPKRSEWTKPKMSIAEHFKYKFILAPEGHDVASSLQWIMASNCVPVMTRPTVESWLMHSRMVAERDYVEVAPDYSDLEEKLQYYIAHPDEAEAIAEASKRWAARFADRRREKIISLLVMERYLRSTGSLTD